MVVRLTTLEDCYCTFSVDHAKRMPRVASNPRTGSEEMHSSSVRTPYLAIVLDTSS
jgi:hypothetical protein